MALDGCTEVRTDEIGLIRFLRDLLNLPQIAFQRRAAQLVLEPNV